MNRPQTTALCVTTAAAIAASWAPRLPPLATAKHPSSPSLPPPPPPPPIVKTEGRLWTAEPRRWHGNFISDDPVLLGQDDSEAKPQVPLWAGAQ